MIVILSCSLILLARYESSRIYRYALTIVAILSTTLAGYFQFDFQRTKTQLTETDSEAVRTINQRFIVGFNDWQDVSVLAQKNIAGIFLTTRNIQNTTVEALKLNIQKLQAQRKSAGLKELIVVTDQEGGPVSRLAPLIGREPGLASFMELAPHKRFDAVRESARIQGSKLANIGVNVNFSPVVDLVPTHAPNLLDFHSQISSRAISLNPQDVIDIALPYIQGLEEKGITATLKHFPGLGAVKNDTHHFSAKLSLPLSTLETTHWFPFFELTRTTQSWIMLSHVIMTNIDGENPASTSATVIDEIIRKKFRFAGTLVTDDLTMAATYNRGFCKSVIQTYQTSANYLLIAYDYDKYFDAVDCILSH